MSATHDKTTQAIREAAAEWIVRLDAPDVPPADNTAFTAWLRRSPEHVREYLRAETAWAALTGAAARHTGDVEALLAAESTSVHFMTKMAAASQSLRDEAHEVNRVQKARVKRFLVPLAIAATVLLVLGFTFVPNLWDRLDPHTYVTDTGEQRRIVLPDGSSIELNTRTRLHVDYTGRARTIHLVTGEAFFDVAEDAARPFSVVSDTATFRALGTQFNVRVQPDHAAVITVVEGSVAVEESKAGVIEAQPGDCLEVVAGGFFDHGRVDAARATAWRQRRLIFDNEPLSAVIEEFNRYNTQQLELADPALGAERLSGVFAPDKLPALLQFLRKYGDWVVVEQSDRRLLLERAAPR